MPNKLLIVEQQVVDCEMLANQLRGLGFDVVCAADERECLEMAGRETSDIIIIDLDTPNLNGVELVELLRREQRVSSTPIIVLAAHGDGRSILALNAGADGVAHKPVHLDTFTVLVEQLLKS